MKENIVNKCSQFKSVIFFLPSKGFAKNLITSFIIIITIITAVVAVDATVIIIFLYKTNAVSSYLISFTDGQNTHFLGSQYSQTQKTKMLHFLIYFVPHLLQPILHSPACSPSAQLIHQTGVTYSKCRCKSYFSKHCSLSRLYYCSRNIHFEELVLKLHSVKKIKNALTLPLQ